MVLVGQSFHRRSLLALLIASASLAACGDEELVIADFSKSYLLNADVNNKRVVGLHINAKLNSGPDLTIQLGCNGKVHHRIVVNAQGATEQKLDWYSKCAEVSFDAISSHSQTLRLRYRFQEM
jgi:hypothetical protein